VPLFIAKIEMDFGRCVGFIGGFAIWDSTYAFDMIGFDKSDDRPLGKRNVEIYFEMMKANLHAPTIVFSKLYQFSSLNSLYHKVLQCTQ